MITLNNNKFLVIVFLLAATPILKAQKNESNFNYNYSLKDLSELAITTGSIKEEGRKSAPSNISIITQQMIEERGYKTLVDICQDLPGFDFMTFNDGGGEYPSFNMNRGMGNIGNPEILIMVDGIIQNNISYNWSNLWTYENMLIDIERIEIIQGPGSVMYGAQAFTGIIHLITKKDFTGIEASASYGANLTYSTNIHATTNINDDTRLSFAFHNYNSEGDMGQDRYDPGSYFKNIKHPVTILADYDANNNYVKDLPNSMAGKKVKDGFNTLNNSYAVRTKLNYKNTEVGFFLSELKQGYGSAIVAYEYDLTDKENTMHFQNYHVYANNNYKVNAKLNLNSSIVYRSTNIIPDGGFKYLYQFTNLRKNYASYTSQAYIEERLLYSYNENNDFSFGFKSSINSESDRIISLGEYPSTKQSTGYSWDKATLGEGINQHKKYNNYWVKEFALYTHWDHHFSNSLSSSSGIRYDFNSEFGSIVNPRIALNYEKNSKLNSKLMFGTAFRQPSIYELYSEFRGNPNLTPQRIKTIELELSSLLLNDQVSLKINSYYSLVKNLIGKITDTNMPAGERFENIGKKKIAGITGNFIFEASKNFRFYANYNLITGLNDNSNSFYELEHVAKHKINAGIEASFLENRISTSFRVNQVGKRKAPVSNKWLQTYKNGYAPSYIKANLSVSYKLTEALLAQVIINNVFNEKYYGMGRESGSGYIEDYDYQYNINPNGYIPAYHPQPQRTAFINIIYRIHK